MLELALEQSHGLRVKVEACAEVLASTNDDTAKQIAEGATMLPAESALVASKVVEGSVQECVLDVHRVTETLSDGIDDHQRVAAALRESQATLAVTVASLHTARAEERKARLRAMHDSATGLPNRELFDDRLARAIALAARHHWTLAVMFVDLDGFKSVNDEHGHAAGDLVLKEIARRLLRSARDEDTVCRAGGDEFLVLVVNPKMRDDIQRLADLVARNARRPVRAGSVDLVVTASVGIAVYPGDASVGDELVAKADAAMYRAKKRSNSTEFFDAPDTA